MKFYVLEQNKEALPVKSMVASLHLLFFLDAFYFESGILDENLSYSKSLHLMWTYLLITEVSEMTKRSKKFRSKWKKQKIQSPPIWCSPHSRCEAGQGFTWAQTTIEKQVSVCLKCPESYFSRTDILNFSTFSSLRSLAASLSVRFSLSTACLQSSLADGLLTGSGSSSNWPQRRSDCCRSVLRKGKNRSKQRKHLQ